MAEQAKKGEIKTQIESTKTSLGETIQQLSEATLDPNQQKLTGNNNESSPANNVSSNPMESIQQQQQIEKVCISLFEFLYIFCF